MASNSSKPSNSNTPTTHSNIVINNKPSNAFTIIELLIVIVIVSIIMGIALLAYSNVTKKAIASSLQSDLSNTAKLIQSKYVLDSERGYVSALNELNNGNGVMASSGNSFVYTYNNNVSPAIFCLSAYNGSISYVVTSSDKTVRQGGCIDPNGLVLNYDAGDSTSFRGEPTVNLVRDAFNLSGTQYGSGNQWTSYPTAFDKVYLPNEVTPLGLGATKVYESGRTGVHHLTSYGSGGEYDHTLSCYIKPLSSNITNFTIGLLYDSGNLITYNFVNKTASLGSGAVSGFIEEVKGYPGWFRVGGNHRGRYGGWVGSIGIRVQLSYQGIFGENQFLIAGVQLENLPYATPFVNGTRGNTVATGGGFIDISGNNNHGSIMGGAIYDSSQSGSIVLNGSTGYIDTQLDIQPSAMPETTIMGWLRPSNTLGSQMVFSNDDGGFDRGLESSRSGDGRFNISYGTNVWSPATADVNTWQFVAVVYKSNNVLFYKNSTEYSLNGAPTGQISANKFNIGRRPAGDEYFNGRISSIQVYNRALTPSEITQNFNALRGRYGV